MINLGSIGKGYAIDRAVDVIRGHWWPTSALVHGGRSSLFALGSPPGRFGGRWEVALRNPFRPEIAAGRAPAAEPRAGDLGRGVPAVRGRRPGLRPHPRPAGPASRPHGPASVTVLAPTAAEADALSTAFYLLGPEAAAAYVAGHPEVGVVFVERGCGRRHAPGR